MNRKWIGALAVLLLAYSASHFWFSGIRTPLAAPNIRQIASETRPLSRFIAQGGPLTTNDPRQYGPVFLAVMHPLLFLSGDQAWPLSRWLYGVQLTALAVAFTFCTLSFVSWMDQERITPKAPRIILLIILWANFSPLYTIVATKGVEMWELALISVAMYAYIGRHRVISGAAIAAATLIKVLPGAYLFYFLVKDRRTFAYGVAAFLLILTASHLVYGPQMGALYGPRIVAGGAGTDGQTAFGHHENLSVKNTFVKLLGTLKRPDEPSTLRPELRGYAVEITPARARVANLLGNASALLLLGVLIAGLGSPLRTRGADDRVGQTLWEWSLVSVMMLLISPALTFEYMVLALPAFSFAILAVVSRPDLRSRPVMITLAAAVILVANIVPRQVINQVFAIPLLLRWTGWTHLQLSEGYQYFGLPLVGLVCMAVCLLSLRRQATRVGAF